LFGAGWLLLWAGLAGCAGGLGLGGAEPPPPERQVHEVEIQGAAALDEDDLLAGLATHPPRGWIWVERAPYDPVLVRADRDRIEAYYARHGYFSARVVAVDSRPLEPGAFRVVFHVEEGQPSRIDRVRIAGGGKLEEAERRRLQAGHPLETEAVYRHQAFEDARQRLTELLHELGFAHGEVTGEVRVDRDARAVAIVFSVDSGPRTRFGPTRVNGLDRIPESAVRNRIAWQEGEPTEPEAIALTRRRLFGLEVFSSVAIELEHEQRPARVPVDITLIEGLPHELKLGVGAGIDQTRYELRARADYSLHGLLHPLNTLRLRLRPAYQFLPEDDSRGGFVGEASAGLEQADFLFPRLVAGVEVGWDLVETEAYQIQGLDSRLRFHRAFLADRLVLNAGYRFRYQTFLQVDRAIEDAVRDRLGLRNPYRLAFFEQALTYDGRDDPMRPRLGFWLGLFLELGGRWAGGDFDYIKLTPEVRGYVPLHERLVLAGRLRFGWAPWAPGDLPITQRYFSGGATSQRGFSQQQLSPLASNPEGKTVPIGGRAQLETSLELRFDAFQLWGGWFGLVAFVDGADVTRRIDSLDPLKLHWAAGGGLRYHTPVGPLRFDFGWRLNRTGAGQPEPGTPYAFHLSLGQAF
jgi:translocation and assembly module TamA